MRKLDVAMVTKLEPDDVGPWVSEVLLNESRKTPVVAVTTQPRSGRTLLSPEELETALGEAAEVVWLETGEATWELAEVLPPRLDCYGGAARIWWPGLREDSNPYDHRLYFVHNPYEARRVFDNIVAAIRGHHERPSRAETDVLTARVRGVDGARVELEAGDRRGLLRHADIPVAYIARCLEQGMEIRVRAVRELRDGRWEFSTQNLLPSPWECAAENLKEEDVVTVRVTGDKHDGVFVELLPQVRGFVWWELVDYEVTEEDFAEDIVRGEVRAARVGIFNPERKELKLNFRSALLEEPGPLPSLVPGGLPFTWPQTAEGHDDVPRTEEQEDVAALRDDLQAASDERDAAVEDRKELNRRMRRLKEELRSTKDKLGHLKKSTAAERDPLSNPAAFLLAVRLTYARNFDEHDRMKYPLREMRVGASFLDAVRALLGGIQLEKILEVCAQVASGLARDLPGRKAKQFDEGPGGSKTKKRADDAIAWRCALQVNTASARRLHWWEIPGGQTGADRTIEFVHAGLHDDMTFPEK